MRTLFYALILLGLGGIYNKIMAQDNSVPAGHTAYSDNDISRPSGYFELSLGLAEPMSGFMNAHHSGYGGYAMPGENFNLSLAVPINHSNIGLAFMYGNYLNAFDINTYVSNIAPTDPSKSYQALLQDSYDASLIMGGLFATIPIDRLSIDFRVVGGIAFCYLPEIDYGASQYDQLTLSYNNYEWDTYSSRSTSFAYAIGADLRYRIHRISLMLGVDYVAAMPQINTQQQYIDPNGNSTYTPVGGNLQISILSANIGFAYEIR
ncbi:MAG TPA: hypothetical protein VNZ45_15940 [Bacteroidia bacterium]|jgi:hypothetical protein|nr:hypothetical protein [Bacteroidia bacterium]